MRFVAGSVDLYGDGAQTPLVVFEAEHSEAPPTQVWPYDSSDRACVGMTEWCRGAMDSDPAQTTRNLAQALGGGGCLWTWEEFQADLWVVIEPDEPWVP